MCSYKELFEKRLGVPARRKLGKRDFYSDFFNYYGLEVSRPLVLPTPAQGTQPVQDLSVPVLGGDSVSVAPLMVITTAPHPLFSPVKPFPTTLTKTQATQSAPSMPQTPTSPTTKGLQQNALPTPLGGKPGRKPKIFLGTAPPIPTTTIAKEDKFLQDYSKAVVAAPIVKDKIENLKDIITLVPQYKDFADRNAGKTIYPIFVRDVTGDKDSRINNMAEFSPKNVAIFLAKMASGDLHDVKFKTPTGHSSTYSSFDSATASLQVMIADAVQNGRTVVFDIHGRKFEVYHKPFDLNQKYFQYFQKFAFLCIRVSEKNERRSD